MALLPCVRKALRTVHFQIRELSRKPERADLKALACNLAVLRQYPPPGRTPAEVFRRITIRSTGSARKADRINRLCDHARAQGLDIPPLTFVTLQRHRPRRPR